MAEAYTGVGLGVQTPDIMTKLSNLLTVKSQQQALQGQAADVQMTQQTARQRAAIAKHDMQQYIGPNGIINLKAMQNPGLQADAGDDYIPLLGRAAVAQQQQLEAQSKLINLNGQARDAFAEMVGPLISASDLEKPEGLQKFNDALTQFGEVYGKETLPAIKSYSEMFQKAPPEKRRDALRMFQLQAMDASQQAAAQQRSNVSTGAVLKNVNSLAAADNTADIPLSVGPGTYTDANGRQFILDPRTNQMQPVGGGTVPPGASPNAPGPKFTQPVPNQKEIQDSIETARRADADPVKGYGASRHVNDTLLKLSEDTATGPGTETWHRMLGGAVGLAGGNAISDYQTINAMLDRQAAMSATQMGLPDTNAGLQTAASLSGTTSYEPKALQTKVKLTDALVEGAHQYRQGLDKVVGTGQNQDLTRYNDFRSQWADNFDPNIFRAENAIRRGDKKELQEIKKEVGAGMADLKKKSDNLRKLADGQLL